MQQEKHEQQGEQRRRAPQCLADAQLVLRVEHEKARALGIGGQGAQMHIAIADPDGTRARAPGLSAARRSRIGAGKSFKPPQLNLRQRLALASQRALGGQSGARR
jgi:hypothetical protein